MQHGARLGRIHCLLKDDLNKLGSNVWKIPRNMPPYPEQAQSAIHKSKALKSKVHLEELTQQEARNMELDYEGFVVMLKDELNKLGSNVWKMPRNMPPYPVLGGPGVLVEIDESLFARRKNNVGRAVAEKWVLGGYEPASKRGFLVEVPQRNAATLLPIIQQWVAPAAPLD
nr:uncharacterized protein LOC129264111 [Lytechinus pictus]